MRGSSAGADLDTSPPKKAEGSDDEPGAPVFGLLTLAGGEMQFASHASTRPYHQRISLEE